VSIHLSLFTSNILGNSMMSHGKRFESAAEIALAYHLECIDTCRVLFENSAEFLGLDLGCKAGHRSKGIIG
jgi:hypothetical protein